MGEVKVHDQSLAHFGVLGMKWGVHRTATQLGKSAGNWGKEAGKMIKSNYTHPIITSRANRESKKADTMGNRVRRTLVYQNTKDLKDINKRIDTMVAEKAAQRALNKAEKAKVKEIKDQYRKEYMAGESALGKVYAKLTDGDKIYADIMYESNKK